MCQMTDAHTVCVRLRYRNCVGKVYVRVREMRSRKGEKGESLCVKNVCGNIAVFLYVCAHV